MSHTEPSPELEARLRRTLADVIPTLQDNTVEPAPARRLERPHRALGVAAAVVLVAGLQACKAPSGTAGGDGGAGAEAGSATAMAPFFFPSFSASSCVLARVDTSSPSPSEQTINNMVKANSNAMLPLIGTLNR